MKRQRAEEMEEFYNSLIGKPPSEIERSIIERIANEQRKKQAYIVEEDMEEEEDMDEEEEMEDESFFGKLPAELEELLLSSLSVDALLNLCQTNRKFSYLCQEDKVTFLVKKLLRGTTNKMLLLNTKDKKYRLVNLKVEDDYAYLPKELDDGYWFQWEKYQFAYFSSLDGKPLGGDIRWNKNEKNYQVKIGDLYVDLVGHLYFNFLDDVKLINHLISSFEKFKNLKLTQAEKNIFKDRIYKEVLGEECLGYYMERSAPPQAIQQVLEDFEEFVCRSIDLIYKYYGLNFISQE